MKFTLKSLLLDYMKGKQTHKLFQEIKDIPDDKLVDDLEKIWIDYELDADYIDEIHDSYKYIKKRIFLKNARNMVLSFSRRAAILLVPILTLICTYLIYEQNLTKANLNPFQVSANAGQMTDIILPDNSKVTLNSGSRITYNTDYKNNQRFVTLEGEALFDIEKNPHMPFIVHTQYFDIEVLGTTFNVMAYESEDILETSLVEGVIKLTLEKEGQLYTFHLEPNQKALYNKKNNNIEIVRTNNYKETAWLKGILVFHSDPFDHIKEQLERKYDVAIHLDFPYSQEDKFTGVFDNKSLDEILHNLQIHYGFRYKIEGRNVNILKN